MNRDEEPIRIAFYILIAMVSITIFVASFFQEEAVNENSLQSMLSSSQVDIQATHPSVVLNPDISNRINELEKEVQFLKIQIEQLKQEKARMDCIRNEYKEQKDFQNCVKEKCESLKTTNP